MAADTDATRRSYGTGALWVRADSAGRETWYGQWRAHGRQVKRRIGPQRSEGCRDAPTRNAAAPPPPMLAYAQRRRGATGNPAREIELPAGAAHEDIRFLDPAEVDAVAAAAIAGPYQAVDRALYLTAAMTGLRQGELIAL